MNPPVSETLIEKQYENSTLNLQPTLNGNLIELRPLVAEDFEELYAVAADPLVWEQHPMPNRYQRDVYLKLFQEFIETKGTLAIIDVVSKKIIGSSRFYDYKKEQKSVAIGFTLLARKFWGGTYNRELKKLMMSHAFKVVHQIIFHVGENNIRSQKALEKIGAIRFDESIRVLPDGKKITSLHYKIDRSDWSVKLPVLNQNYLKIETPRLILEPIEVSHAQELVVLFSDSDLHKFVPQEPPTLEEQKERCERWSKRISPDGKELWLNWVGRHKSNVRVIAHFQAGVKSDGVATVAYLVSREFQNQGLAAEGLNAVFIYLREHLHVKEIKAWSDTRNIASHRLAEKMGMKQVELIKDADLFKGSTSDEFVFSKVFES